MGKYTKFEIKTKHFLVYYYVKLPKSFKGVTVDQYQRILPIYQKIEKETDTITIASDWCRILSILSGVKPNEIEQMPINKLKQAIASLSWLVNGQIKQSKRKYLIVNGVLHRAKLSAKEFNTAQYVEIKTFLGSGNWVGEMHRIAASIYSPLTWSGFKHDGEGHEKRAEGFKKLSVVKVFPTVFFYSILWQRSISRIQEYGLKIVEQKNKEAEELLMSILRETLEDIGDGTQPLTK